jgi:sigma-B regulation protein RsbU (phosphoserine phosphatase)
VASPLRLVRDETPPTLTVAAAEAQAELLQAEIDSLKQEVALLRRRDEMVHFYLHGLDEEMRLAARLQEDFLPKELPQVGSVRFNALFRPCGYVSGDLYDVFRLDETHVGFYLADAMGHGVPSALLTLFLRTSLVSKEIFSRGYRLLTPAEALGRLNSALVAQSFSHTTFATAIYGMIDVSNLEISFAQAGHPRPMLIPGNDSEPIRELEMKSGALLGVFPNETYQSSSITLSPGDRLLLHSDGIETVFRDEPENTQPWQAELIKRRHMETPALLAEFSARLDAQSGSLQPKDDLTVIAIDV